jgi:ABC-type antimicrobial peptide transport system permease subunit
MITNYLKTAWRAIFRNKAFSTINILGLALGLTCSLLIMLWVQDERRVDGFHANGKQLYQVYERQYNEGKIDAGYFTQGLLADELKRTIPEVQYASSLERSMPFTFEAGDKLAKMEGSNAGPDFFSMFSYPLLQGTPSAALNTPTDIAISRKMAEHFFGSAEKAFGKTIRYDNREDLVVTAVFENIPAHSSQQFDFVRSWAAYVKENTWVNNWGSASPMAFVQLRPDADVVKTEAKIKDFIYRYIPKNSGAITELALQPYTERYLYSTFNNGRPDGGRIEYVQLFTLIAVFILLIACINFMNLATARSAKRAKEVGVRKVIGALRLTLIVQFIGEAMLLTLFAVTIAFVLAIMLLPAFNSLTGKQLVMPVQQPVFWAALLGLVIITGFIAGSYPALFLSSLRPVRILKGSLKFSAGALFFRKGLVVFQFSLSIIIIVGMIVIYRQLNFVQHKNLGYDRENLVYVPIEGDLIKKYALFKEEARSLPAIVHISEMKESPTVIGHRRGGIGWEGKDPGQEVSFADAAVGYDFVKTMNLQIKEGRDFSPDFRTDSAAYLINETALARIGYKEPIGKPLYWGEIRGTIIGVLKDFHFTSMHETIEPLFIRLDERPKWGTILVRTKAGKTQDAIAGLEKICKALNPNVPFTFQFSDLEYAKLYKSEQTVSRLSNVFAFLAIFISCLGLFGLATFSAAQRTKEIGVRKILGASSNNIVVLLSTNFLQPVILAMLIAFPIAWYAMHQWLQHFAYRIGIAWWMFALAGLLTLMIALLTVSFQSIKAALMNPAGALRND